jgi:hypothetical protein
LVLDHSQQKQDDDDQQNQTDAPAWPIAPVPAVWPTRNGSEQEYYQNNEQYQTHVNHLSGKIVIKSEGGLGVEGNALKLTAFGPSVN